MYFFSMCSCIISSNSLAISSTVVHIFKPVTSSFSSPFIPFSLSSFRRCEGTDLPTWQPRLSLSGALFPYHPRRIDGDSFALRSAALMSPKRRSVWTQGSLSLRTFAARDFDLSPHRTYRYLSISLFLSFCSLRLCILHTLSPRFSPFPRLAEEERGRRKKAKRWESRGGVRSNHVIHVNGRVPRRRVPRAFGYFRPRIAVVQPPLLRPLRPAADLPAAQRERWVGDLPLYKSSFHSQM